MLGEESRGEVDLPITDQTSYNHSLAFVRLTVVTVLRQG